jgi:hypothetical protein
MSHDKFYSNNKCVQSSFHRSLKIYLILVIYNKTRLAICLLESKSSLFFVRKCLPFLTTHEGKTFLFFIHRHPHNHLINLRYAINLYNKNKFTFIILLLLGFKQNLNNVSCILSDSYYSKILQLQIY